MNDDNKKNIPTSTPAEDAARRESGIGEAASRGKSVDDILKNIMGGDGTPATEKVTSHQFSNIQTQAPASHLQDDVQKPTAQIASQPTVDQKQKAQTFLTEKTRLNSVMGSVADSADHELDREALEQMDELIRQQKAGMSLHKFMVTDAYFKVDGLNGLAAYEKDFLEAKDSIFVLHIDATRMDMIEKFTELTKKAPYVFGVIGYGPSSIRGHHMPDITVIEQAISSNKKFIGVGEIGLDYHYSALTKEEQKYLFEMQLRLAKRLDVPAYITSKDADADTYAILNKLRNEGDAPDCVCVPVVRTLEMFQMVLDHSMHIILRPEITYDSESLYRECIKEVPKERLLVASGEEVTPPQKHKGRWNKPQYIQDTISYCVEEIFKEDKKDFLREVSINFNDLFNSDPEAGDDEFYFQPSVLEPTLIVTEAQLLENDRDADGDELFIKELEDDTLVGNVFFDRESRLVIYTPKRGFIGADKFKYVVTDGRGGQDKAVVTIFVAERAEEREAIEDAPIKNENLDTSAE